MPVSLATAYRRTTYRAGDTAFRIGVRNPGLDSLLRAHGARQAALLSACNPWSRKMPDGWNRRMHQKLTQQLHRVATLPAEGRWHRWAERHRLVFLSQAQAATLARKYCQNAIVMLRIGQPPVLVVLSGVHLGL